MKSTYQNFFNSRISSYVFLLFLFFSMTTAAHASPVRIDVIDDSGHYLKQYPTDSRGYRTQRAYLEAVKGRRYKIRIRNTSNRRIGVVVAVDGRNILTGKKSYLRSNEKMYVLDPYETSSYNGWRTSQNRINRFYFTSAGNSYSNAWGDRSAMGVIAVAVFNEKQRYYRKRNRSNFNGKAAPSASRSYDGESTGTGYGREEYSPSVTVRFLAENNPARKYFYKYEWRSTLCKRRVINCYRENNNHRNNNRFWPEEDNRGFAPPPPNYPNYPGYPRFEPWDDYDTSR